MTHAAVGVTCKTVNAVVFISQRKKKLKRNRQRKEKKRERETKEKSRKSLKVN